MKFDSIPLKEFERLSTFSRPITLLDIYENPTIASVIGVRIYRYEPPSDYEFIDTSYYECLKKYGIHPSLQRMISLHNYILEGR